jgi:Cft2 family RNA processing exonuclease
MEIKFLGFGGAFDYQQGNSAAVLEINGNKILIDCGHSVYSRLREFDIIDAIDYVLLTHLHADHCGSLPTTLIHRKLFSKPLTIIYPEETFYRQLHDFLKITLVNPDKYCRFQPITDFSFVRFIGTKGFHVQGMQTFAYVFYDGKEYLVYSGDFNKPAFLLEQLSAKGVKKGRLFHDVSFNKRNKAHAYYKDIEEAFLVNFEVYGYHYNPQEKAEDCKIRLVGEEQGLFF